MRDIQVWVCGTVVLWAGLNVGAPAAWPGEPKSGAPVEKVYQNAARSFVIVEYHRKKSDRPAGYGRGRFGGSDRSVLQQILNKNTAEAVGVIISDAGEVLTSEQQPQLSEDIAEIRVRGWDGTVVPAEDDRILVNAPGRVVRLADAMPTAWRALEFVDLDEVTAETKLCAAMLKPNEQDQIHIVPCGCSLAWSDAAGPSLRLQVPDFYPIAVLCDAAGRPAGVALRKEIDLGPNGFSWRGADLRADAGVSAQQQEQLEDRLENDFAENIYEITIVFRRTPREETMPSYASRYYMSRGMPGGQERLVYGLGYAEDRLLVPQVLPRALIAGIDTISVKVGDEKVSARFGGVLRQCDATVIELEEGTLPRTVAFAAQGGLPRTKPFWAVCVRELAGMDARARYARWIETRQGYADKWYPVLTQSINLGSWLLDAQGTLVGLYTSARHENDRLESYLLGEHHNRYRFREYYPDEMSRTMMYERYGYGGDQKIFEGAELTRILADLPANYDEQMRHLTKDEQKRRVWLGVEYTAPSKEMVKQMDLRVPTEDGRIGLMVNRVYAGSPAARLGLSEGDILLTLAVPGTPWPIELTADEPETYGMPNYEDVDIPREFEAMGMRMPRRRPWPSRANTLTSMLDNIGVGTSVTLRYIHDGETVEKDFVIEQSPRDMLSAAKYKNEKLGLTVKDLTYEVRAGLQLDEKDVGVVIVDVEQGTPAALARINVYELIRAVDGRPAESVEVFEKLITEAQGAGRESVRLTVEWMGKTRLADLKFDAKAPTNPLKSMLPGMR